MDNSIMFCILSTFANLKETNIEIQRKGKMEREREEGRGMEVEFHTGVMQRGFWAPKLCKGKLH